MDGIWPHHKVQATNRNQLESKVVTPLEAMAVVKWKTHRLSRSSHHRMRVLRITISRRHKTRLAAAPTAMEIAVHPVIAGIKEMTLLTTASKCWRSRHRCAPLRRRSRVCRDVTMTSRRWSKRRSSSCRMSLLSSRKSAHPSSLAFSS